MSKANAYRWTEAGRGTAAGLALAIATAGLVVSGAAALRRAWILNAPSPTPQPANSTPVASGPRPAEPLPTSHPPTGANGSPSHDTAAVRSTELGSVSQQSFLARAEAATVRVSNRTRGLVGNGTIVAAEPGATYVLTASHLVGPQESLAVVLAPAANRGAEEIRTVELVLQDPANDLALLRLQISRIARPLRPVTIRSLQPAGGLRRAGSSGGAGVDQTLDAVAIGGQPPGRLRAVNDTVTARRIRRRPDADSVAVWEGTLAGDKGESGGGLLDLQGRLIGVRSGNGDGRAYYAHLQSLHEFLARLEPTIQSAIHGPTTAATPPL